MNQPRLDLQFEKPQIAQISADLIRFEGTLIASAVAAQALQNLVTTKGTKGKKIVFLRVLRGEFFPDYVRESATPGLAVQETTDCADSIRLVGRSALLQWRWRARLSRTSKPRKTGMHGHRLVAHREALQAFRWRFPICFSVYSVLFRGYRVLTLICVNLRNLRFQKQRALSWLSNVHNQVHLSVHSVFFRGYKVLIFLNLRQSAQSAVSKATGPELAE